MRFVVQLDDQVVDVEVEEQAGRFLVTLGEERLEVETRLLSEGSYSFLLGGASYLVEVGEEGGQLLVEIGGEAYRLRIEEALRARLRSRIEGARRLGAQIVRAPMPGRVVGLLVSRGDQVTAGSGLVIIEAMKMENELRAAAAGEVKEIKVVPGEAVTAGQILMVIGWSEEQSGGENPLDTAPNHS